MDHFDKLPPTFLRRAADVLGDTQSGLTGAQIVSETCTYAAEYGVNLPHSSQPFEAANKRQALFENLSAFTGKQQYRIIFELCGHARFAKDENADVRSLRLQLTERFHDQFGDDLTENTRNAYLKETRHWLERYPEALRLFTQAEAKLVSRTLDRNLLDDLRLCLEVFLREVLDNDKPLEKQIAELGAYNKSVGGSKEFVNMFERLMDYYTKYQNSYVKHTDGVIPHEVDFVFELTSAFMRHFLRISSSRP